MKRVIIRVLIGLFVLVFLGYAGAIAYLMTQETQLTFYETYGKPLRTVPPDSAVNDDSFWCDVPGIQNSFIHQNFRE